MKTYTIQDLSTSSDRFKLFVLLCSPNSIFEYVDSLESRNINVVNIGEEVALFIENLDNYDYLQIETQEFLSNLLDNEKSAIQDAGNNVVAIYNLGILLEPYFEINAVQFFKDFSKSTCLVIIWEDGLEMPNKLYWPTQEQTYYFDFTDLDLKQLQYAI